jgi:predicted alpha-1,2-mannosidase
MKVSKAPKNIGYWKKQREMKGVEAEWDPDSGRYKIYKGYTREMSGDDVGVWFSYDTDENEQIEVKMGVSFVSIENARLNMNTEQPGFEFDKVRSEASDMWNADLSKVMVEGGSYNDKVIFYTAMYHLLIHPNIIQDVNGEYPMMESLKVGKTSGNRYTVFSLWDTYRNVSTLMSLLYPEKQLDIIRTMIDMYKESGWLPKWELFGRETLTMEGDPSIPYIVDAYMRGLRDYDVETAYEAMKKGANTPGEFNLLRPDNDDYMTKGYVPLKEQYDNSVSHALEYYIADYNLSLLADALGKKEDAKLFRERAMGYKHYYSKE